MQKKDLEFNDDVFARLKELKENGNYSWEVIILFFYMVYTRILAIDFEDLFFALEVYTNEDVLPNLNTLEKAKAKFSTKSKYTFK